MALTGSGTSRLAGAAAIARECLDLLAGMLGPGVTTSELDRAAESFIVSRGARPAFKGYRGYPASICASPNEVVIHGIPDDRPLAGGDILSLDLGVCWKGFFADLAGTFPVGEIDAEKARLIETTRLALDRGIAEVGPGVEVDRIGRVIEETAREAGFSVVRSFCGHGIGRKLHEEPEIANYENGNRFRLVEGLALAIEPMVNYKTFQVHVLSDGWTVVTADRQPSAHFEDTVLVTESGYRVLTRP